jgi:DNA-binding transcriptional regulator YiaG
MDAAQFEDARWRLKLTQAALAEVLHVHPVTVNKWEQGKRPIPHVVGLALRGLLCEQTHGRAL